MKTRVPIMIFILLLLCLTASCSVGGGDKPARETSSTQSNIVRVVFPEGCTVVEIAALLEKNGVCPAADFIAEAQNEARLADIPAQISNSAERPFLLEGYVFPDTYDFYRNESASSAMNRFLKNTRSKIKDEILLRADELGYSLDEIITIASIIQEEAGNPAEMGKVSSVLHNRLNKSNTYPRLQFDVGTFYLRESVKPYITEGYEEYVDLYNTYICLGLPAGPITNPGIEAINAALYPEDTDYEFFVTDSEGNYYYAETWSEHKKNCKIAEA